MTTGKSNKAFSVEQLGEGNILFVSVHLCHTPTDDGKTEDHIIILN